MQFDLDPEELEVFCLEADEFLEQLDTDLLALEQGAGGPETIQRIFRAAHTLKGSAGVIGHHRMANLTHTMETLFDLVGRGQLSVSGELVDILLNSVDALKRLVDEVRTGQDSGVEPTGLIQALEDFVGAGGHGEAPRGEADAIFAAGGARDEEAGAEAVVDGAQLQVSARIAGDSFAPAARALQVLLALEEAGTVLWSQPARNVIELGGAVSVITVGLASAWSPEQLRKRLAMIGEISQIEVAALQEAELATTAARSNGANQKLNGSGPKTVRTSVERLDNLMNLVGELVTDRNRLLQTHMLLRESHKDAEQLGELAQAISHLATITDELQEEVMRARMLPLEHVFNRFPRMVRDLARDMGKQVHLDIAGQETELDRSVIEEIADPLMHLLRNAVDHGLELPEERRAANKPETGVIRLGGRSEGGQIKITVSDDGRGIDTERVLRKAVERGLVSEEAAGRLSQAEVLELIFSPGLTTSQRVTDVSGRGVGMDVVRSNIERLHGTVNVVSQSGQGTTFELSLPLTLAIMPVLLVSHCGGTYCVPLGCVAEVLQIDPQTVHTVDRGEIVVWRGCMLPLLRLRRIFRFHGLDSSGGSQGRSLSVVAVRWGEDHVGLVVDSLLGQQEIVIKSLGQMIGQVPGLSGATVLGDGSVALIVDVPGLVKQATRFNVEAVPVAAY